MSLHADRGFLPRPNPLQSLDIKHNLVESLASDMPMLLASHKFRDMINKLPVIDYASVTGQELNRLMLIYSYFASAYIWGGIDEKPLEKAVLPKQISVPFVQLANKVGRPPILSYDSYCLQNWKTKNGKYNTDDIVVDNLELLQNFVDDYDEDWFILIHVDIEARGGRTLTGLNSARCKAFLDEGPELVCEGLKVMHSGLTSMVETFARMPEKCSPDVYYKKVRPYIFSFENVVYEDCFDNVPKSFRGETGAQSSLVPAIQLGLGIRHKQSMLTEHLNIMRDYMPPEDQSYLKNLEASVLPYDESHPHPEKWDMRAKIISYKNKELNEVYTSCIEELGKFREMHFQYAVDYIHKKVDNPTGTGGTPFMKWLKELRDETESFKLS
mgnify:FL=1